MAWNNTSNLTKGVTTKKERLEAIDRKVAIAEANNQNHLNMPEEQRNAIYAAAESQRVAAEQRADVERERGVVDARSSYEKNKASYGVNAEAIGSMGLAGSGYSDYLNSRAYAQQRAETQAANAQADASKREARYTEDQARLKADSDYYQNKHNEAANARAAYTELLSGANSGAYTAEQLEQLAADYGLSEAQRQSIIDSANDYTKKSHAAASAEIAANTGDIAGYTQFAVESGTISKEQGQEHLYNYYKDEILHSTDENPVDTGAIDEAYENKQISPTQYDDLKSRWNDSIDTSADFFYSNSNGTMVNKSAAKQALDNISKQPWLSKENKAALNAIYYSLYTPVKKPVSFNTDGRWWVFGSDVTGEKGNNFSVKTSDGTIYRVEYGGEATDTNIKEVGASIPNEQVFGYQGKIYIKQNGKIYKVQGRANSYGDHYDSLYNTFFGRGDPTSVQSANNAGSGAKKIASDNEYVPSWVTTNRPVPVYPSDNEIASKASSGTLTYHDVAKYNSGISTASEFGRPNNSEKQTHGTYQAYLQAMYDKYAK